MNSEHITGDFLTDFGDFPTDFDFSTDFSDLHFNDPIVNFTDDYSKVSVEKIKIEEELFIKEIKKTIPKFICVNFPECTNDITIDLYNSTSENNLLDYTKQITKEIVYLTQKKNDMGCPYEKYNFYLILKYKEKYATVVTVFIDIININDNQIKILALDAICTSRYFRRLGLSKKLISLILKCSLILDYNLVLINSYSPKTYPLLKKYFNAYYTYPPTYSSTDIQLINPAMKDLLTKINKTGTHIQLQSLAHNKAYNTIIMLKYPDGQIDKDSILKINETYMIDPINKIDLEKSYTTMITEIPDEKSYFLMPNNEILPSYIDTESEEADKSKSIDIFKIPAPKFLEKYLKYKNKYLKLKNSKRYKA